MNLEQRLFNITHTIPLDRDHYNRLVDSAPKIFGDRWRIGLTASYDESRKYLLASCLFWKEEVWPFAFILSRIAASTYEECREFTVACEDDTVVFKRVSKEWSSSWDVWVNGKKLR